jgi:hypothetical protein
MRGAGSGVRRGVVDFALAFSLFWSVVLAFGAGHGHAHATALPVLVRPAIAPEALTARPASVLAEGRNLGAGQPLSKAPTDPDLARLLLSLAFATLAALNLGFWRHLRRVYASPRRGRWRRG